MLKSTIALDVFSPAALTADQLSQVALGPFPIQSLFSTMSLTMNSNTVTVNINDVLPAYLNMLETRELSRYNGACPVKSDTYYNYDDAVNAVNSPFAGWESCVDTDLATRGSYALDSVSAYAGGKQTLTFTCFEPLLISPAIWGNCKSNNSGIYGIVNCSLLFNIGNTSRVLRYAPSSTVTSVAFAQNGIQPGTTILFLNYLTPHPSQLLSSKCCVPYYDVPRYISSIADTIPAVAKVGNKFVPSSDGAGTVIRSQSLQLNQIPDKLIIYVRETNPVPTAGANAPIDGSIPDRFLAITNINVNWNNMSGMLSSFSQYDLWRASVDAGSSQSWNAYRGFASVLAPTFTAPAGGGACVVSQTKSDVALTGSLLVLDMARTIALVNDFDAPKLGVKVI